LIRPCEDRVAWSDTIGGSHCNPGNGLIHCSLAPSFLRWYEDMSNTLSRTVLLKFESHVKKFLISAGSPCHFGDISYIFVTGSVRHRSSTHLMDVPCFLDSIWGRPPIQLSSHS
jgi:hypothetical protein